MTFSKILGLMVGSGGTAILYSFDRLKAKEMIDCHECRMKRLPKAKELPLYEKSNDNLVLVYDKESELPLLSEISKVRKQIFGLATYVNAFKDGVLHVYETGVAHSQSSFDYLTSEENKIPRILAILSGGFVGYVLARKRGVFRKLLFVSVGTGLVFSSFYPTIAKEYASIGWEHTKYHTSNALEKYGGYDPQKLANEAKEKAELVKSTLKLEGVTNKLQELFNESKEKASKVINIQTNNKETSEKASEKTTKVV